MHKLMRKISRYGTQRARLFECRIDGLADSVYRTVRVVSRLLVCRT